MAQYRVTAPDGRVLMVTGPAGATNAQVQAIAAKNYKPRPMIDGKPYTGNALDALGREFVKGATFNTSDEIGAGVGSVAPWAEGPGARKGDYAHNVAMERRIANVEQHEHPIASTIGNIGGVIAGTVSGARLLKAVPLVGALMAGGGRGAAVARAAAGAGIAGAASGAGEGDSPKSRLKGAEIGGATGMVVGGALGTAGVVGGPVVAKYWNALRGTNTVQQALGQIAGVLKRAGYDVDSATGKAALQRELTRYAGRPVTLADMGTAPRNRAVVAMHTPGPAQAPAATQIAERVAGQGQRLTADIKANVAPRTDIYKMADDLAEQRAGSLASKQTALDTPNDLTAQPTPEQVRLYMDRPDVQTALSEGGELPAVMGKSSPVIPEDPVLQKLAELPLAAKAVKNARQLANATRDRLTATGAPTDHLPLFPEGDSPLDMRALDAVKRSLDDEVNAAFASTKSGVRAKAPELRDLRNEFRDRMRAVGESSPGAGDGPYAKYLDIQSGTRSMEDAIKEGFRFSSKAPEEIAAEQASATPAEQELYRAGAARKLVDKVNQTADSGYPADKILNSPEARSQLAATGVNSDSVARLTEGVQMERNLNLLPRAAATGASKAMALAGEASDAGGATKLPIYAHSLPAIGAHALNFVTGAVNLGRNAAINNEVLPRLTASDPVAIQKTIDDLVANGQAEAAKEVRRAAIAQAVAGATGNIIGSNSAIPERGY